MQQKSASISGKRFFFSKSFLPYHRRNLYPYIRLGPRGGGKDCCLTVCVTRWWADLGFGLIVG